jgi:hypothetical protein
MSKTMLLAAAVATLTLGISPSFAGQAQAKSISLAGDQLRRAVSGKTVSLNISGFELPIHYSAGGIMSGSLGVIAAAFAGGESLSDRGSWWVANDQLCQRWTSWMDGKSYCRLTQTGSSVRWVRNDGRLGTARMGC